jgi:hypothetical protein
VEELIWLDQLLNRGKGQEGLLLALNIRFIYVFVLWHLGLIDEVFMFVSVNKIWKSSCLFQLMNYCNELFVL